MLELEDVLLEQLKTELPTSKVVMTSQVQHLCRLVVMMRQRLDDADTPKANVLGAIRLLANRLIHIQGEIDQIRFDCLGELERRVHD